MNMNTNKIKGHIYFIFGLLFILYITCIRFFIQRLPKDLTLPFNLFTIITFLWITIFFYILFILNLRYSLIQLGYIRIMRSSVIQKLYSRLILPYLGKYTFILAKSLVTVHEVFSRYLNPNLLKNIGIFMMKNVNSKNSKYLVVLFDFLPKGLILFCLIIDVFIYKELSFIYKFGSFLLIPLCFRYILFAICTDCLSNLKEGDNSVCINTSTDDRITSFDYLIEKLTLLDSFDKTKYHYIFTQEFLNETQKMTNVIYTETLKQFMLTINLFVDIYIYIKQIQKWRENTILYFNLFLYLGYNITWTYTIFLVLST
jgi:hypothetical protein